MKFKIASILIDEGAVKYELEHLRKMVSSVLQEEIVKNN